MSYSIKPILHHAADKNGLHKIQILIIYKRMKFTLATHYRTRAEQFVNGRCTGFKNANIINSNLVNLKDNYEKILLNVIAGNPGKDELKQLFAGTVVNQSFTTFCDYAFDLSRRLYGKLSAGRISHYKTFASQVKEFGDIEIKNISNVTATALEKHLRESGLENNTINSKMKIFIAIVNHAKIEKLVAPDCLLGYKKPAYVPPIPDFLTEGEIEQFKQVTDSVTALRYKTAGYYFLLSCYTGYRISDLAAFDYTNSLKGDKITIRAKKNKEVVTIPIYPKLAEILDKIKDLPFYFTEQSMRKYVKELAMLAGLARKIKVHTARHTFAMMLTEKDFSEKEIAELLGDSVGVARIYSRILNKQLHKSVREKLN